jgi:hypothetical protein
VHFQKEWSYRKTPDPSAQSDGDDVTQQTKKFQTLEDANHMTVDLKFTENLRTADHSGIKFESLGLTQNATTYMLLQNLWPEQ